MAARLLRRTCHPPCEPRREPLRVPPDRARRRRFRSGHKKSAARERGALEGACAARPRKRGHLRAFSEVANERVAMNLSPQPLETPMMKAQLLDDRSVPE